MGRAGPAADRVTRTMGYKHRRKWAMQYDDHIQLIICKALRVIEAAPALEDMRCNADFQLIYSAAPAGRVAARVRSAGEWNKYFHEVTFRFELPSGVATEWQKMLAGYGDWMVYGFAADDEGDRLRAWIVLNLAIFRQHVADKHVNRWELQYKTNPDDGIKFVAYPIMNIVRCQRCLGAIHQTQGHGWLDYELSKAV